METKKSKLPVSSERIYKIMLIMTFGVAGIFFLKNLIGGSVRGAVAIGVCLLVFAAVLYMLKKLKLPANTQQLVISVGLMLVVFMISMNSGDFLSDDFILLLAVIALSGLYLEPLYPIIQGVVGIILLIVLRVLYPHKADPDGQYIMCLVCFAVAAFLMYLLVKRGKAYIELGNARAEQAEKLLRAIRRVGDELEENYQQSSGRIVGMSEVNDSMKENVLELKKGSESVTEGTREVDAACLEAMNQVVVTEEQVKLLNAALKNVEEAMDENRANMRAMSNQMQKVRQEIADENEVFAILQQQITEIAGVTEQLTSIAASTKMLALNASIEAARAGSAGAGFAVVAAKVQNLAVDSNKCSDQVVRIVNRMQEQIEQTAIELKESVDAIEVSIGTLNGLEAGNAGLIIQFGSLYESIDKQNHNIKGIDSIFGNLRDRVQEMGVYAEENQAIVDSIVTVTDSYREYVGQVIEGTKQIHDLSANMLDASDEI